MAFLQGVLGLAGSLFGHNNNATNQYTNPAVAQALAASNWATTDSMVSSLNDQTALTASSQENTHAGMLNSLAVNRASTLAEINKTDENLAVSIQTSQNGILKAASDMVKQG